MVRELERLPHTVQEVAAVVLQKLCLTVSGIVSWIDLLESLQRIHKYNRGTACVHMYANCTRVHHALHRLLHCMQYDLNKQQAGDY